MRISVLAVLVLSVMVSTQPASAALGERVAVPSFYRLKPRMEAGYGVHEETSGNAAIKEFTDPTGVVFAVAWSGAKHPDLASLFGKRFSLYRSALARTSRPHWRNALEIKSGDIVVRMGGRIGAVRGFAYVPSLVPDGVSIGDLK